MSVPRVSLLGSLEHAGEPADQDVLDAVAVERCEDGVGIEASAALSHRLSSLLELGEEAPCASFG